MNLPHMYRFKKEIVLTVGILPGPHEPKLHMNTFLYPLVSELIQLQNGVTMIVSSSTSTYEIPIRCWLLSVACEKGLWVSILCSQTVLLKVPKRISW